MINADEIIKAIGNGVCAALKMNDRFLGLESSTSKNAKIHPEYLTTVNVAVELAQYDRKIVLEDHMKSLKKEAQAIRKLQAIASPTSYFTANNISNKLHYNENWKQIDSILDGYIFGKKDSERLDIVVHTSHSDQPPLLIVEVKLGGRNFKGITKDIDRVIRILAMYNDIDLLENHCVYGAIIFDLMKNKGTSASLQKRGKKLFKEIKNHLLIQHVNKSWLKSQVGMLSNFEIVEGVSSYQELDESGNEVEIFAKDGFAFTPCLILLGNAMDVETVTF